ncbi:MAG: AMP-binding protein [Burkholderiales bacterium]
MNLAQLLVRSATVFPDRPALFDGVRFHADYRGFAHRAACIAGYFQHTLRLAPGQHVALFMSNCTAYLEVLYAAWWAGLVVVPINAKLHPREVAFILRDAEVRCVFAMDDLAVGLTGVMNETHIDARCIVVDRPDYGQLLAAAPIGTVARGPEDLAWLFYTSGTTGQPKGVMLSNRNLLAMTLCYHSDVDSVSATDATVYAAPASHGAGMYNFVHVLRAARHVMPASRGFDPAELCALGAELGPLSLFAAPTMVKRLVTHIDAASDPSREAAAFKTIVYGGGPMYVSDIQSAIRVMGDRFVQIYGQGESPMTITALGREHLMDSAHPRWLSRIGSVGVAQSAVEVRVADAAGNSLPVGETGEILVRGDTVMAGYWRNPGATARTLRDGWLWTGDMGALDEDGFLTLKDRSKDLIISGGSNIYPREVEEVLLRHPSVREVAVVGRPDPEWGEVVIAFVVADQSAHAKPVDAAALDALCLDHIARFKRPKEYRFVAALPKNNYGKVLKTELRAELQNQKHTQSNGEAV